MTLVRLNCGLVQQLQNVTVPGAYAHHPGVHLATNIPIGLKGMAITHTAHQMCIVCPNLVAIRPMSHHPLAVAVIHLKKPLSHDMRTICDRHIVRVLGLKL